MANRTIDVPGLGPFEVAPEVTDEQFQQYLQNKYKLGNITPTRMAAVIQKESSGNPKAISPIEDDEYDQPVGLMQIRPSTARDPGLGLGSFASGTNLEIREKLMDPDFNIQVGNAYLDALYKRYGNWYDAHAAYNMGFGGFEEHRKKGWTLPDETLGYAGELSKVSDQPFNLSMGKQGVAEEEYRTVYVGGMGYVDIPANASEDQMLQYFQNKYKLKTFLAEPPVPLPEVTPEEVDMGEELETGLGTTFVFGNLVSAQGAIGTAAQQGLIEPETAAEYLGYVRDAMRSMPLPEVMERAYSGDMGDFWDAFAESPLTVLSHTATVGLGSSTPILAAGVAGGLVANLPGAAGAVGTASFLLENGNKFLEVLEESGVDVSNSEALAAAFQNEELMSVASDKAARKGVAVGFLDAVSVGLGGVFLRAASGVGSIALRGSAEVLMQGGLGAAGEVGGQALAGDEISGPEAAAEFIGELLPGIGETAIGMIARGGKGKKAGTPPPEAAPPPRTEMPPALAFPINQPAVADPEGNLAAQVYEGSRPASVDGTEPNPTELPMAAENPDAAVRKDSVPNRFVELPEQPVPAPAPETTPPTAPAKKKTVKGSKAFQELAALKKDYEDLAKETPKAPETVEETVEEEAATPEKTVEEEAAPVATPKKTTKAATKTSKAKKVKTVPPAAAAALAEVSESTPSLAKAKEAVKETVLAHDETIEEEVLDEIFEEVERSRPKVGKPAPDLLKLNRGDKKGSVNIRFPDKEHFDLYNFIDELQGADDDFNEALIAKGDHLVEHFGIETASLADLSSQYQEQVWDAATKLKNNATMDALNIAPLNEVLEKSVAAEHTKRKRPAKKKTKAPSQAVVDQDSRLAKPTPPPDLQRLGRGSKGNIFVQFQDDEHLDLFRFNEQFNEAMKNPEGDHDALMETGEHLAKHFNIDPDILNQFSKLYHDQVVEAGARVDPDDTLRAQPLRGPTTIGESRKSTKKNKPVVKDNKPKISAARRKRLDALHKSGQINVPSFNVSTISGRNEVEVNESLGRQVRDDRAPQYIYDGEGRFTGWSLSKSRKGDSLIVIQAPYDSEPGESYGWFWEDGKWQPAIHSFDTLDNARAFISRKASRVVIPSAEMDGAIMDSLSGQIPLNSVPSEVTDVLRNLIGNRKEDLTILGASAKDLQALRGHETQGLFINLGQHGANFKDLLIVAVEAGEKANADLIEIAAHEGWHFLQANVLDNRARAILEHDYNRILDVLEQVLPDVVFESVFMENGKRATPTRDLHKEAQAYLMGAAARDRFGGEESLGTMGLLEGRSKNIFKKALLALARIKNWIQGRGYKSVSDYVNDYLNGKYMERVVIPNAAYAINIEHAAAADMVFMPRGKFWKWFGNSVIVNPDGTPRVVYHATSVEPDFKKFSHTNDIGYHFATTIEQAHDRVLKWSVNAVDVLRGMPDEGITAVNAEAALAHAKKRFVDKQLPDPFQGSNAIEHLGLWADNMEELKRGLANLEDFVERVKNFGSVMPPEMVTRHFREAFSWDKDGLGNIEIPSRWVPELDIMGFATRPEWYHHNARVIPAYLRIENPLHLPDLGVWDPQEMVEALVWSDLFEDEYSSQAIREVEDLLYEDKTDYNIVRDRLIEIIKLQGFDGISYYNFAEGSVFSEDNLAYIVFDSNQVKSPFASRFSPFSDEISSSLLKRSKIPENTVVDYDDIGKTSAFIRSARDIASYHPGFSSVFFLSREQTEHRTRVAASAAVDASTGKLRLAKIAQAKEEDRIQVTKALELVRRIGLFNIPEDGYLTVPETDKDGNPLLGLLSKPGETIQLTPTQMDIIEGIREGKNLLLQDIKKSYLLHNNLDENTTYDQITEVISDLKALKKGFDEVGDTKHSSRAANMLKRFTKTRDFYKELEQMERVDYMPFSRFGSRAITVKDADGKLLWMETIETQGINKIGWKKRAAARRAALQEQFPGMTVSPAFTLTKDFMRQSLGDFRFSLDMLSSLLSEENKAAYIEMRDEIIEQLNANGFGAHLMTPNYVPGYSHDIVRAYGQYTMAAANYSAKMKYHGDLLEALNDINPGRKNLREYAKKYIEYTASSVEELSFVRNMGFLWFLGGNVSSAALQWATLPTFTGPWLSQFAGAFKVGALMTKNFAKVAGHALPFVPKAIFGMSRGPDPLLPIDPHALKLKPGEKKALIKAWESGIVKPTFTLEQAGFDPGRAPYLTPAMATAWGKTIDFAASFFNTAETIGRITAFLTAHELASDPVVMNRINSTLRDNALWQEHVNLGRTSPEEFAAFAIDETFGVYGKANRPTFSRGYGTAIFQFQTYPQQMTELLFRMARLHKDPSAYKGLALMIGALLALGGVQGMPGAEDLKEIFEALYKSRTGVDLDVDLEFRKFMMDVGASPIAAEMVSRGVFRSLIQSDISRRAALGNMPAMDIIKAPLGVKGDFSDALGVPGSLYIGSVREFNERLKTTGNAWDAAMVSFSPMAVKNVYESIKWNNAGVKTRSGERVLRAEDLNDVELVSKAFGFNPAKVVRARDALRGEVRTGGAVRDLQSDYYKKLSNAINDIRSARKQGDDGAAASAREQFRELLLEVKKWNATRPTHEKVILDTSYLMRLALERDLGGAVKRARLPKKARAEAERVRNIYTLEEPE